MNISYFGHNGKIHTTPLEATNHERNDNLAIILAVSIVAIILLVFVVKLLSNKKEKK